MERTEGVLVQFTACGNKSSFDTSMPSVKTNDLHVVVCTVGVHHMRNLPASVFLKVHKVCFVSHRIHTLHGYGWGFTTKANGTFHSSHNYLLVSSNHLPCYQQFWGDCPCTFLSVSSHSQHMKEVEVFIKTKKWQK